MSKFNKQIVSSSKTCSCGKHEGVGNTSPHERAQMYNWFRHKYSHQYDDRMKGYLNSYEAHHGALGKDEFLYNSSRWAA
jgi:hypothetical protein